MKFLNARFWQSRLFKLVVLPLPFILRLPQVHSTRSTPESNKTMFQPYIEQGSKKKKKKIWGGGVEIIRKENFEIWRQIMGIPASHTISDVSTSVFYRMIPIILIAVNIYNQISYKTLTLYGGKNKTNVLISLFKECISKRGIHVKAMPKAQPYIALSLTGHFT